MAAMYFQREIVFPTGGRGTYNLTDLVRKEVAASSIETGLCNVFIRHTSASLIVCENADPDVMRDLEQFLHRLVPDGDPLFVHTAEGPDDMPAHVRSVLTLTEVSLPICSGKLGLGTWQGIYLYEHRSGPHERRIVLTVHGE
jgi:secondary thiamine-phosphate synthase enzyme